MSKEPARIDSDPDESPFLSHRAEAEVVTTDPAGEEIRTSVSGGEESPRLHPRLQAMIRAARHHGVELDPKELVLPPSENAPSAAALSLWAQNSGMWSRAVRIGWRHLLRFQETGPVVLLFNDGSAGLVTDANPQQRVAFIQNPYALPGTPPVAVDELRMSEVWAGEAILLRASRSQTASDAPFNLRWLIELVLGERKSLRDIGLASFTISFLTLFPPIIVMTSVNKVLQFNSVSTLAVISAILAIVILYETLLSYARRLIISVVGA